MNRKGLLEKGRAQEPREWQIQKSSSEPQGESGLCWKPKKSSRRGGAAHEDRRGGGTAREPTVSNEDLCPVPESFP